MNITLLKKGKPKKEPMKCITARVSNEDLEFVRGRKLSFGKIIMYAIKELRESKDEVS
jgi:hypothetical protein